MPSSGLITRAILIIACVFIFALIRADPEAMWQRRARVLQRRGQEVQRPSDWERMTRRTKAILIACMIIVASVFVWKLSW